MTPPRPAHAVGPFDPATGARILSFGGYQPDHVVTNDDLAITVDDMPVNMRTHAHGQGYADLNFLIPELISSVNIRKGPYFADEGDFSSVGNLHIGLIDSVPST